MARGEQPFVVLERAADFVALDARAERAPAIVVRLVHAPTPRAVEEVRAETDACARLGTDGLLRIARVDATDATFTLVLESIDPAMCRLDVLLASMRIERSPLGAAASAHVVDALANTLAAVHAASDPTGRPRVHAELHPGVVLIDAAGRITVIGSGSSMLRALLIPRSDRTELRARYIAPELLRGSPHDARADVYGLGILYYEMLSGRRHREHMRADAMMRAALEQRPADLPGDLPDPRPRLLELLRRATAPAPEHRFATVLAFSEAVREECDRESIALGDPQLLGRMIHEFVPTSAPRGLALLAMPEWLGEPDANPPTKDRERSDALASSQLRASTPPKKARDTTPNRLRLASIALALAVVVVGLLIGRAFLRRGDADADTAHVAKNASPHSLPTRTKSPAPGKASATPSSPQPARREPQAARSDAPSSETAHAEELRPKGFLAVMSQPSGATVEIDGGYVGKTPLVLEHAFDRRRYRLAVLMDGYLPWEKEVEPDPSSGSIHQVAVLERESK